MRGSGSNGSAQVKKWLSRDIGSTGRSSPTIPGRLRAPGAAGVDERLAGHRGAVAEARRAHRDGIRVEPDHLPGDVTGSERAGLAPEPHEGGVGVDPGVVIGEHGEVDPVGGDRRKPGRERTGGKELDLHPHPLLEREVPLHLRRAARVGDEEVALAPESDLRSLALDRHRVGEVPVEREAVARHLDVLGQAEQPADAPVRSGRRGVLVGRIALDDDHVPGPSGASEVVRDARVRRCPHRG